MIGMMDIKYHRALRTCHTRLAGTSLENHKEMGTCIFQMGVVLARLGEIQQSIRCFNDAFLMRDDDAAEFKDAGWKEFHDVQMTIYIMGKHRKCISSLAEGDMVHDLIKHRWQELDAELQSSEIPFAGVDKRSWFRTVRIDFPWDLEVLTTGYDDDYSQFVQYEAELTNECVNITH
jgi:hypothetical protein